MWWKSSEKLQVSPMNANPHPGPMTRSLPLARPFRAFASQMELPLLRSVSPSKDVSLTRQGRPFAAAQAAQVPHFAAERETLFTRPGAPWSLTQTSVGQSSQGPIERLGKWLEVIIAALEQTVDCTGVMTCATIEILCDICMAGR
jgi:hypothetical protein